MRIPKWVEVTAGEVPTTLSYHGDGEQLRRRPERDRRSGTARQPLGRNIITALWGNCTIKVMVGFLFLYPAFVAKSHDASGWEQLRILGLIGAAAVIGNFAGNFASARLQLGHPAQLVVRSTVAVTAVALATALTGNLLVAAFATLVTSGASAIAKASLDASLQDDLPDESRASAFGRSESLLQLAWVAGGATGVLIYTDLWVGFTTITAVLILGLAQTLVSYNGDSLIPGFGGNRPVVGCPRGRSFRGGAGVKRVLAVLAAVAVVASVGTAFVIWRLGHDREPQQPEISAYSRGHLTRVGPYRYCEVLDLNACQTSGTQGELPVNERDPVQLSVSTAIARAPWRLFRVYEDPIDTTRDGIPPGHPVGGDDPDAWIPTAAG